MEPYPIAKAAACASHLRRHAARAALALPLACAFEHETVHAVPRPLPRPLPRTLPRSRALKHRRLRMRKCVRGCSDAHTAERTYNLCTHKHPHIDARSVWATSTLIHELHEPVFCSDDMPP
eukprot:4333940-Pleurochrysis_carterae.AAC.1